MFWYKNKLLFCSILLLGWLPTLPLLAQNPDIEYFVVDNGTDMGMYSSIACDENNNLHFSYYDNTGKNLRHAIGTNGSYSLQTIDLDGDVGKYSSLAIDNEGNRNILYYDATLKKLKYAGWLPKWEIEALDTGGNTGLFSSIYMTPSNQPSISYYNTSRGDLMFAAFNGSTWDIQSIDTTGNIGLYTSFIVDEANNHNLLYYDFTLQKLKYAGWLPTWEITTVDNSGNTGLYSSISMNSDDYPAISYYNTTSDDLKVATFNGNSWDIEFLETIGNVGLYTCYMIDAENNNNLLYYDATLKKLKYAGWLPSWEIDIVDEAGNVGLYSSIACDGFNQLHISYYDVINQDLMFASGSANYWEKGFVATDGDVGKYNTLGVTSPEQGNKAWIFYYDDTQNKLASADKSIPIADVGNIAGMVTDEILGLPLNDAIVSAINDATAVSYGMQTNEEGNFEIKSIPPGTYTVKASKNGYSPQTSTEVLVSNDSTTEVNFVLTPLILPIGILAGNVINETTQQPISEANIEATNNATGTTYPGQTNDEGSYQIENLPAGIYTVEASKAGYLSLIVSDVEIITGETSQLDFILEVDISVKGSIAGLITDEPTGQPIAEANAKAINDETGAVFIDQTDEDGTYELENVPSGVYTVELTAEDYFVQTTSNVVVNPGETTQVDFVLPFIGIIAGNVTEDFLGLPIADASLVAVNNGTGLSYFAESSGNGTFGFEALPPETYTVEVSADGYFSQTIPNIVVSSGNMSIIDFSLTFIVSLEGIITDFTTLLPVQGAEIILTGQNESYQITSDGDGYYGFFELAAGTYNITITKGGYQTENLMLDMTEPIEYQEDFDLVPVAVNSLVINSELTAYADEVVENPNNVFTLSGEVNINEVLWFDGEVKIDKRPGLAYPEIQGSCGFFAKDIDVIPTIYIKHNNEEFWYYTDEDRLIPQTENYLLDGDFSIGGFNITIGEIIIDPDQDFVEVKSIAKMPFPINKVADEMLKKYKNQIPLFVKEMSGSRILSKENGVQTAVNINDVNVNIGIVSLENVNLYWNTNTQTYGGGFKLNIPGSKPSKDNSSDSTLVLDSELKDLQVELRDENEAVIDSLSFEEFLFMYRERGFKLLSVGAEIEFVQGSINKIIVSIGTKVPIGPTGLFLTEITGGLEDLATKNWKIIANVDIELGFEVPILGSPVKLNDFGVKIQPWEEFTGKGEFQVFDQPISDGSVTYNRKLSSLSAKCRLNLGGVMKGQTAINLVGGQINGFGLLTIQTPGDLPWILSWAENKRIGFAQADLNNQYFQSAVELDWIKLAQKLEFGKQGFPWFHYYLGKNLDKLHNVWKGEMDGKQAIIFQVPENTGQLMVVAMDTLNPTSFDFSIQSPTGQIIDQVNAQHYELDDLNHQTIMSVLYPIEGDWYFLTDYPDDVALHTSAINQQPTTLCNEPQSRRSRSNQISLSFNDFSDTLNVQVHYDNNSRGFDGSLIDNFVLVNNGILEFTWQNDHVPNGEYYIYCRVDDSYNTPVLQYAPGSVWVENDVDIETPENYSAVQENESVLVSWDRPTQSNTIAATVYIKNISSGWIDQESVYDSTSLVVNNLDSGQEYELWACFINENGTYSEPGNKVNLIFSSQSRNNPPYFTLNPDSTFVFVVDQEWQYTLTANDADGNDLTFEIPNDTLGISLDNDVMTWTPAEDQKGVYNLMLTVNDGTDVDTTYMELVVYTQNQVSVDLAFSSVNLYEDDNMFVKISNYFCPDYYQQVMLRNIRTQEEVPVECRRVNDFEYIGQFGLSFIKRSEIAVANGDTIEVKYNYGKEEYLAYAYYDSLPQPSDQNPPGTIIDLEIVKIESNQLKLRWTATGNDGNQGEAYKYDIRYAYEPIDSEDVYFTAFLIQNFPYPSHSGLQDSLIIDLNNLVNALGHDTVYFSVKAEDEIQNRGALSNSPGENCLISPQDMQAEIVDVFKINLEWSGPTITQKGETGFEYYNLYRKFKQGYFYLLTSGIESNSFTDNLEIKPDGIYQYAVQARYETGVSDTLFSLPVDLDRYEDISILCSLEDSTNYQGISFTMQGLDTVYTQSFNRITNPTGLVLLGNVFKTWYAIEISKEGFDNINDTIEIGPQQTSFNFKLLNTFRAVNLNLAEGWSGISIPINPVDANIEMMFNPILIDLIILQNSGGVFWPGQNVNTLGAWNTHEGYQIKVANAVELTISGTRESNKSLQLATGWNLIPVLSECDANVAALFSGNNVTIIKEVAGTGIYWPEFGINTLGVLEPGKAYFVLMNADGEVTFPECDVKNAVAGVLTISQPADVLGLSPWQLSKPTAQTHSIAIPVLEVSVIQNGDIIGAFDSAGSCFGVSVYENETISITLFGDDPTTSEKDGFTEGENIIFKRYRPSNGEEFDLKITYENRFDDSGLFHTNGMSVVKDAEASSIGVNDNEFSGVRIYPNPSTGIFKIEGLNGKAGINIYNAFGEEVKQIEVVSSCEINLSGQPWGVYFIRINGENGSRFEKVILD